MIDNFKDKNINKKYILAYILTCIFFFIFIELIQRKDIHSFFSFLSSNNTWTTLYLILFFIFTSLYVFIFKNPLLMCVIHYTVWCIISFISSINSYFKGSPLIFEDLFLIREASDIASKYINKTVIINLILMIIVVILVILILRKSFKNISIKLFNFKNKFLNLLCYVVFLISFINITNRLFIWGKSITYTVSDFNLIDTYNKNGFLYSFYKSTDLFLSSVVDSTYDVNKVLEIKERLKNIPKSTSIPNENIIVIQLESLFDPTKLNGVNLSSDPLKNFHALSKENKSGEIIVPVIGGGTIQTEFEILTGINIKNLYSRMPYLNILNHNQVETIANIFREYGYSSTGFHNYFSTFYNRVKAYENMGFEKFVPLESISGREKNHNFWYKDTLLIDEIINTISQTENKDFIFGVTVEAHGPYNTYINGDITVKSDVLNEKERIELQNYVNIIKNVDDFIVDLIYALNKTNENYTLIFYSDHLPSLGENQSTFNKTLNKEDFFKTPYLIISSDKSKKFTFDDKNLHSYELMGKILDELNLNKTIYHNFREIFKDHENFSEYENNLLLDIKYKNVYDNNVFPYKVPTIKIGTSPQLITNIEIKDGCTYVIGDNFTPNSKIYVNRKPLESNYISKNSIEIKNYTPKDGDVFTSVIFSNKNSPLGTSNVFKFQN